MDFEKAYKKFLDGTATDEEVQFVRTEIAKARKLTKLRALVNASSKGTVLLV